MFKKQTVKRSKISNTTVAAHNRSILFGDVNGDCAADVLVPTHDVNDQRCAAPAACYDVWLATRGWHIAPPSDGQAASQSAE